jgi:hypothetical protein
MFEEHRHRTQTGPDNFPFAGARGYWARQNMAGNLALTYRWQPTTTGYRRLFSTTL